VNESLNQSAEAPQVASEREPERPDQSRRDRIVLRRAAGLLRVRQSQAVGATVMTLLGTAFIVVGMVDLGLLWSPLNLGRVSWEFATLSQTFDSLPMTGLGFGLLAFGFLHQPRSRPLQVRLMSMIFGLATLFLIGMAVMYFTVAPEVMRQAPPEAMTALNRAVVKNVAEIIIYPVTFGTIAVLLWRSVRKID
jgi:hypothetical protein